MCQALCWALERLSEHTHTLHLITTVNIGGRNLLFPVTPEGLDTQGLENLSNSSQITQLVGGRGGI